MRLYHQLINTHMNMEYEGLTSYPFLRRGNYQFKISILKENNVLVIANHMMNVDKFFVKHFKSLEEASVYIEMIIEKDMYGQ